LSLILLIASVSSCSKDQAPASAPPSGPAPSTATFTPTPTPFATGTGTPTVTPTSTETAIPTPTTTPTVGCEAMGNTLTSEQETTYPNSNLWAVRCVLDQAGTLTEVRFRLDDGNGLSGRVGLYTNVASQPVSLLVQSAEANLVSGWNNVDVPDTALDAGIYWIAFATNCGTFCNLYVKTADIGGPTTDFAKASWYYPDGALPEAFPTPIVTTEQIATSFYGWVCP
jgi:hypothetical protein